MAGVLIMTLEEAVTDLTKRIMAISPEAVIRVIRNSSNEASIRAYAAAEHEAAIKDATWEQTFKLLCLRLAQAQGVLLVGRGAARSQNKTAPSSV
jgi:hypothetical protein